MIDYLFSPHSNAELGEKFARTEYDYYLCMCIIEKIGTVKKKYFLSDDGDSPILKLCVHFLIM